MSTSPILSPDDEEAVARLVHEHVVKNVTEPEAEMRARSIELLPHVRWFDEPMPDPRGGGRPPLPHRELHVVDQAGNIRRGANGPMPLGALVADDYNRRVARFHGRQIV